MAITAYVGPPGSGKSYALVSEVIIPAVASGRRVLTNVAGIKPDLIAELAGKRAGAGGRLGSVVPFDGLESAKPGFWPSESDAGSSSGLQAGDLLVMDEVRLYWPAREAFPRHVNDFLRFHRHWVSADGVATDIVLASQLITDFHRDYRGLIEKSFRFKKLNTLGLGKRVVWNMWEGSTQRKNESVANGTVKLSPDIWKAYGSYRGNVSGVEQQTDKRANVLRSPKLWAMIAAMVVVGCFAAWQLGSFFAGPVRDKQPASAAAAALPPQRGAGAGAALPPPVVVPPGPPPVSSSWRVAGFVEAARGVRYVVLIDKDGNSRIEPAGSAVEIDGAPHLVVVEGERVFASSGLSSSTASGGSNVRPFGIPAGG